MILTGKAKEDFIDYLWQSKFNKDDYKEYEDYIENQKESHTYADIIEWFDSVGIYVTIEGVFDRMLGYHRGYEVHIYQDGKQPISLFDNEDVFNIRQQATKQSITKANQIYNDR